MRNTPYRLEECLPDWGSERVPRGTALRLEQANIDLNEPCDLICERTARDYTEAEQQFSQFVQIRMHRLLRGDDNRLLLLRRYGGRRAELGFFMPAKIRKGEVRVSVAEEIVGGVLRFLSAFEPGGPIAQAEVKGRLQEIETFPTRFPHIVVERTDVFQAATGRCLFTEWQAMRVQNQRRSTAINRALDLGNLAMEVARFVRP